MEGNKEFLDQVSTLNLLHHPNLLNLIGHCVDGDQRLLVYEFMPMGSLENHLFGDDSPDKKPLDWFTRMKIASGAANGLEYLHEKANPPIIYRDLKPSNILLDEDFEPKLSDFGLAKLGPGGGRIGTYGYSAPEYSSGGELTLKSDIYSFGVLLLELITGRRVVDTTRPNDEQNLVTWAQPIFRDPKRFPEMADPRLKKEFPVTSLNQAVGIAAMCLQEESSVRPLIGDVVAALSFISTATNDSILGAATTTTTTTTGSEGNPNVFIPPTEQKMDYESEVGRNSSAAQSEKDDYDGSSSDGEDEKSVDQQNGASSRRSEQSCDQEEDGGQSSDRQSDSDDDSDGSARYEDAGSSEDEEEGDHEKEKTDSQQDTGVVEASSTVNITSRVPSSKKPQNGFSSSSSRRSSSRTSSSRRPKGSSRHRVVKFKDPATNMIRSGSEISEDGSFSYKHQEEEEAKEQTTGTSRGSKESADENGSSAAAAEDA